MNRNIHNLIVLFLTLFSLKTYAADSAKGNFVAFCSDTASPTYKEFIKTPDNGIVWRRKLLKFAQDGE